MSEILHFKRPKLSITMKMHDGQNNDVTVNNTQNIGGRLEKDDDSRLIHISFSITPELLYNVTFITSSQKGTLTCLFVWTCPTQTHKKNFFFV